MVGIGGKMLDPTWVVDIATRYHTAAFEFSDARSAAQFMEVAVLHSVPHKRYDGEIQIPTITMAPCFDEVEAEETEQKEDE